jgi:hypothetical protein
MHTDETFISFLLSCQPHALSVIHHSFTFFGILRQLKERRCEKKE